MRAFNIRKDKHRASGLNFGLFLFNKKIEIMALFKESCIYSLKENYDQINKLYGISFNWLPFYNKEEKKWHPGHHNNSARFGWRCIDKKTIEILAYCYIDKKRVTKKITSVGHSKNINLSLIIKDGSYIFKAKVVGGKLKTVKVPKTNKKKMIGYKLFPYFGGRIPAPHNMRLFIKK